MRNGFSTLLAVTSSLARLPSRLTSTKNFSGWPDGCTSKRSNSRNSAHGPSKTSGAASGEALSLICDATRAPGQASVAGAVLPGVNFSAWPSMSRTSSLMPASISSARRSSLKPGVLPPLRKNASLMRAARWKSASAAGDAGR